MSFEEKLDSLAMKLFRCEAIKFGDFKMKSGSNSPIYFDFRTIISYPELMETVVELVLKVLKDKNDYDLICGIPYTALPIASILSVKSAIPMVMRRKEAKEYGTKKLIEGKYKEGDKCMIIEDVITTGSSVLETVSDLRKEKIVVNKAIVILDREQGGFQNLASNGIQVTALLTMSKMIEILSKNNLISKSMIVKIEGYLKHSTVTLPEPLTYDVEKSKLTYEERSEMANNVIAKKLFKIMSTKQTNLCIAADVVTCAQVLELLKVTGPYICMFKLHVDILEDFNEAFVIELKSMAKEYNVVLMEDRKYGDIGNTVNLQYNGGMYKVGGWAQTVTAHALPGPGVLQALTDPTLDDKGIFLVVEMSSQGNLASPQYCAAAMKMIKNHLKSVAGVVCQSKGVCISPGLLQLTPGVQLDSSGDHLGQKYNSPEHVILENDADIVVVGRGITKADNPQKAAILYRKHLWECYEKRINL